MIAYTQNSLYLLAGKSISSAPDVPTNLTASIVPPNDFVLCRDADGTPTAVYGNDQWDFNPYRLSATCIPIIRFNSIFNSNDDAAKKLIDELKFLLYCFIHFTGGGRIGRLSASTLNEYRMELFRAARFCYHQKKQPTVGSLSLRQLFSTEAYLAKYVLMRNSSGKTYRRKIMSLLNHLNCISPDLGYRSISPDDFNIKPDKRVIKQHPIIPTRIYIEIINNLSDLLDVIEPLSGRLEKFLCFFSDRNFGISGSLQKSRGIRKANRRPNVKQAIDNSGLVALFSGDKTCSCRLSLSRALNDIQGALRAIIHLYTGMREQEVFRLRYDCLREPIFSPASIDDKNVIRDPARTVTVISTTTKFEGYKREATWLATEEVSRVVQIAQAIGRGLAVLYSIKIEKNFPLFPSPSILISKDRKIEGSGTSFKNIKGSWVTSIRIQNSDLVELSQSDPGRDFYNDSKFKVGSPWNLTSHQFRRSLAFYGSNSGFLSLPTLKTQYKHLTMEMARYYSNGFDNLRTIFGYFDDEIKDFVLPKSHFAYEFQTGIPVSIVQELLTDLLGRTNTRFGGTGSYMEKQKIRFESGELCIEDVRSDTLTRVKNGEISYRSTLLGGCTKVDRCHSLMLGDFTSCLTCEGAILKPDKIDDAINSFTIELKSYNEDSGEYQITKSNLEKIIEFKSKKLCK